MEGYAALWIVIVSLTALELNAAPTDTNNNNFGNDPPKNCQYDMCNPVKPNVLNVHMVAHTHDDVGWLKTVEEYYYGKRNQIQRAFVKGILDSVIQELLKNPKRKFIYAEMAFFSKWWYEQSQTIKDLVKGLVNRGQLQFICGGWSMNDEAATHYNAIIDQHTIGFRFLEDTFGECGRPRVAWQIDPFGHSREQASIFARFGFDGLFLGRVDEEDRRKRKKDLEMEMVWAASSSLGEQAFIFTGITFEGYYPPAGFCFDKYCFDPQIEDSPYTRTAYTATKASDRVELFVKRMTEYANVYATNNVLITMGGDFHYENATKSFTNLDKLIELVNKQHPELNLIYSTPQCYLQAVNDIVKTWPTKIDDFFPYAHKKHAYWTGYFTSRPTFKLFMRTCNNFFQACKQLDAFAQLGPEHKTEYLIQTLAEALGYAQHHDAATGTAKQHVANDYNHLLSVGMRNCEHAVNFALSKLLKKKTISPHMQRFCPLLNITSCAFTETNDMFTVIVYNPVARPTNVWVTVPVSKDNYHITLADESSVPSVIIPITEHTKNITERGKSQAIGDLVFNAKLPALGFNTYFVTLASEEMKGAKVAQVTQASRNGFFIENQHMRVHFHGISGLMKSIDLFNALGSVNVSQKFHLYYGTGGGMQSSGAYIFHPTDANSIPIASGYGPKVTLIKNDQVQEVRQVYNDWVTQVIRLYDDAKYLEFEWTVGPIPNRDMKGREIISKFTSDLHNDGIFYTDSNGREMMERVRNHRSTWTLDQHEPVAGNYYPVNSRIFIKDEKRGIQMTVLTDRSQGGGSIEDGSVELMVHRRLLHDDGLGVSEALNELGADERGLIARGKHYLLINTIPEAVKAHRDMAEKLFMSPIVSFAFNKLHPQEYVDLYETEKSFMDQGRGPLPESVHLLTLQSWREKSILVRLEHMYEEKEDDTLSEPVVVQLKDLFTNFKMISYKELTLGANMDLEETRRLSWDAEDYGPTLKHMSWLTEPVYGEHWNIKLYPMEIRTFEITFA